MGQKVENRDNKSFDMSDFFWNNQLPIDLVIGMEKITGLDSGNKFGQIPLFSPTDGRIPVWEGTNPYQYQTSSFTPSVASSAANDNIGGNGARKVVIEGNNVDGNEQSEIIELTGQTEATSLLTWSIIYRMYVEEVGALESAAGTIYCGLGPFAGGVPTTELAIIRNGNNQTQMCIFTVPKGYYCAITSIAYTAISGKPVIYHDEVRYKDSPFDYSRPFRNVRTVNVETDYELGLKPYAVFPEYTDLRITALATQNASTCECAFRYILVHKDWYERRT